MTSMLCSVTQKMFFFIYLLNLIISKLTHSTYMIMQFQPIPVYKWSYDHKQHYDSGHTNHYNRSSGQWQRIHAVADVRRTCSIDIQSSCLYRVIQSNQYKFHCWCIATGWQAQLFTQSRKNGLMCHVPQNCQSEVSICHVARVTHSSWCIIWHSSKLLHDSDAPCNIPEGGLLPAESIRSMADTFTITWLSDFTFSLLSLNKNRSAAYSAMELLFAWSLWSAHILQKLDKGHDINFSYFISLKKCNSANYGN